MTLQIAAKKNPPIALLNPTRRRARIADSLYQEGLRLECIQSWLYAMADAAERGNLPVVLEGINAKTQLEVLATLAADSWGENDIQRVFSSEGWYKDWVKKLRSAGIHTSWQCLKAIAALKGLSQKTSNLQEKEAQKIAQLKQEAVLMGIPDYFPTPPALLERMIQLAELQPGMRVLEPSAGSGAICQRLLAASIHPDCFEISPFLQNILTRQGFNLIGDDFMAARPKPVYSRILMNPPFGKGMDAPHVQQAFEWLAPGGRLVSIISCSYIHYSSRKYQQFRFWLKQLGAKELENPAGSFLNAERRTNVNTRMLVIDKPL
jgi:protein-L-isoaspartate O-methyltransferase